MPKTESQLELKISKAKEKKTKIDDSTATPAIVSIAGTIITMILGFTVAPVLFVVTIAFASAAFAFGAACSLNQLRDTDKLEKELADLQKGRSDQNLTKNQEKKTDFVSRNTSPDRQKEEISR